MRRLFLFSVSFSFFLVGANALAAVPSTEVFVSEQALSRVRLEVVPLVELSAELQASHDVLVRALRTDIGKVVADLRSSEPAAVSNRFPAVSD